MRFHNKRQLRWTAVTAVALVSALVATANAQAKPIKEIVASHIGWEVDVTTGGQVCTVASGHECVFAKASTEPGGFTYAHLVAVNDDPISSHYGDVYVADNTTHRIQELTASGQFVSMFGKDVNATTGGNICTPVSGDTCKIGVSSTEPGAFGGAPSGLAVDPASGNVYVAEELSTAGYPRRIQEFSATGEFVLEMGKEVNETTKANICTEEEVMANGVKCTTPAAGGGTEPDTFNFTPSASGAILTIGGPEDLIYVGEEGRIQELGANGAHKRDVSLETGTVVNDIAVDQAGTIYIALWIEGGFSNVIESVTTSGRESSFVVAPRQAGWTLEIYGVAVDAAGRLAVVELEHESNLGTQLYHRGTVYMATASGLRTVSEFSDPIPTALIVGGVEDLTFNANDELYGVAVQNSATGASEVIVYTPIAIGELLTGGYSCAPGMDVESDATVDCRLNGEVNPWLVPKTEAWFQWGTSRVQFSSESSAQQVATGETPLALSPVRVTGLTPNESLYYRLVGNDENVKPPEQLAGEALSLRTPTVPPRPVGESTTPFVYPFSVLMSGTINPENATTVYGFVYGACESLATCPEVLYSETLLSSEYGPVPVMREVRNLQPNTTYHYALVGVNEKEEVGIGPEGSFTTDPPPAPQAHTNPASGVTATSATISGLADPDGQPATYVFELGIYSGDQTHYGVIGSGSAGDGSVFAERTMALSGLQPGTTYAYRIAVSSAYGTAHGEPALFTTEGLPAVITIPATLPLLAVPPIALPNDASVGVRRATGRHGRHKERRQKHRHKSRNKSRR